MNVIFLTYSPLTERDYDRFGIDHLEGLGLKVSVMDMSPFFHPTSRGSVLFDRHHLIGSFEEFLGHFGKIRSGYVFNFIPLSLRSLKFFKEMWRSPLLIVSMRQGYLPSSKIRSERGARGIWSYRVFSQELLRALEVSFLHRISLYLGWQRLPDLQLCAGRTAEGDALPSRKVLSVGSLDYNLFLDHSSIVAKNEMVFLDEFEPFHPDYDLLGIEKIEPFPYFERLNALFDRLERRHGMPVVIAAHPKANKENYGSFFNHRKIIQGKTAELIQGCAGVVAHTSTAIQYAFLNGKPLCCVYTEPMLSGYRGAVFRSYEEYGFKFYNIDREDALESAQLSHDPQLALRYIDDFVKSSHTPELNSWIRFAEYVKIARQGETHETEK